MKRKLDLTITDLLNSNWERDFSLTYNNWLGKYYDNKSWVEETEEQKMLRLAKEKRENRNNKIDQILNDKA
jgi:hypothetical protein